MLVARMSIDRQLHVVRTPFIFVGNNEYQVEGFQLGARAALDRGHLSIFVAPECGRFEILALPLRALANRLTADPKFERFLAEEVTIELSRRRISVALDGEVAIMRLPLLFRLRRAALHLLVPGRSPS
jgi:diacylglycerol kinase family enzyme